MGHVGEREFGDELLMVENGSGFFTGFDQLCLYPFYMSTAVVMNW